VDYRSCRPPHVTFSKAAVHRRAFLFRDLDHWNKVLDQDCSARADELNQKAEVMLIGYAAAAPATSSSTSRCATWRAEALKCGAGRADLEPHLHRPDGAYGIAYNEVYNAIQNGVSPPRERGRGVEQMKFYEVAPHLSMTQHAITIRPLCFSTKTSRSSTLPCSRGAQGGKRRPYVARSSRRRRAEAGRDGEGGKLKRVPFAGRDEMKRLVDP